jgi:hypothetical protein
MGFIKVPFSEKPKPWKIYLCLALVFAGFV